MSNQRQRHGKAILYWQRPMHCHDAIRDTGALPKSHSSDTVSAETLNDACVDADFLPGKLNDVSTNVIH